MTVTHNDDAISPQEAAALVDLILDRYHAVQRAEVPALIRLARQVQAQHPDAPRELVPLLERMRVNLDAHMQKEEDGLFPAMRLAEPVSAVAVEIMRDEHDDHAKHLRDLQRLTNDHTPPTHASLEWRQLCAGTRKLADDLVEHIRLENEVLFPRFGA
ncbi:hemerythrin domain-containing protein [Rhodopila globiformis]|nr:hemerythrin domain-containing protein [Rhodopila globiformis]